jgi:hypothetical protein
MLRYSIAAMATFPKSSALRDAASGRVGGLLVLVLITCGQRGMVT